MKDDLGRWLASLPAAWTEGCPSQVFATARGAYGTPGRHYHAWEHVERCADALRTFPCEGPRPVFLALVFHDAVYIPGSRDNERLSAALARTVLAQHTRLSPNELASVERMILATADHHRLGTSLSADERVLVDIDLAVLGASPEEYARYADGVRREYAGAGVAEAAYRAGRVGFLRTMLARPRIFLTEHGHARWEDRARANMLREIAQLEAAQGWLARLMARLSGRRLSA